VSFQAKTSEPKVVSPGGYDAFCGGARDGPSGHRSTFTASSLRSCWKTASRRPTTLLAGAIRSPGLRPCFSERATIEQRERHGYEDQESFVERPGDR
jgi:hypothetical protein